MNLVPMFQTQAFRKNIEKVSTDKQKLLMTFFVQCTIYMVRMLIRWHLGYFLLRHIGHWNISVICLTVVPKLAITVFISLYSLTEMTIFLVISKTFRSMTEKNRTG